MSSIIELLPAVNEYNYPISNTQIQTWKRCRFKFWLAYRMKLIPRTTKPKKIGVGEFGHEMLAAFYLGKDVQKASDDYLDKLSDGLFDVEIEPYVDAKNLAELVVRRYIDKLGRYDLDRIKVIAVEENAYANIPKFSGELSSVKTQAKLDLVYEDDMGIKFMDHKFVEDFGNREDQSYTDFQFSLYTWTILNMFKKQGKQVPLIGSVLNLISTKLPQEPNVLKSGKLSKDKGMITDTEQYLIAIRKHGLGISEYTDFLEYLQYNPRPFYQRVDVTRTADELRIFENELRNTVLDMYNQKFIYRNINFMCSRDCLYRDLCIIDMKGGNSIAYAESNFTRREVNK